MCRFRVRLQSAPNNKSNYIEANKQQENYYPTSASDIQKKKHAKRLQIYHDIFRFPAYCETKFNNFKETKPLDNKS